MTDLVHIAPPNPAFPRAALDSPGGFVWWYADLLDANMNGVVLIWSYGLPFLPGYAAAARRGDPQLPRERPSLNVSVYEEGKLVCYLLQEPPAEGVSWEGDRWRFGQTEIETTVESGQRRLRAALDLQMPGEQSLTGVLELEGPCRTHSPVDSHEFVHDWAPFVGPARGAYELRTDERSFSGEGRAYFDGNVGAAPLHEAGIHAWTWGRLPLRDREAIYYVVWPDPNTVEAIGVEIDRSGQLHRFGLDVAVESWRRGIAGLKAPDRLSLSRDGVIWARVSHAESVDDGPFYLRYFVRGGVPYGESVVGIGEYCRTDRIDLARHRPLVRMRVHRTAGKNSMWLPLFTGPRAGRLSRLVGGWLGGAS